MGCRKNRTKIGPRISVDIRAIVDNLASKGRLPEERCTATETAAAPAPRVPPCRDVRKRKSDQESLSPLALLSIISPESRNSCPATDSVVPRDDAAPMGASGARAPGGLGRPACRQGLRLRRDGAVPDGEGRDCRPMPLGRHGRKTRRRARPRIGAPSLGAGGRCEAPRRGACPGDALGCRLGAAVATHRAAVVKPD